MPRREDGRGAEADRQGRGVVAGRDKWWHDVRARSVHSSASPSQMDAEDPLFILYTRFHRKTQGRPAHDRRVPGLRIATHELIFDIPGRGHVLVTRTAAG